MRIKLTPEDLQKGLPIDENWYKAEVVETISKPSKDNQSINHVATFQLEGYREGNTKVDKNFNTKAMEFNGIREYLAALSGKTLKEFIDANKTEGVDFDFEQTKGGKLQIKVKNRLATDGSNRTFSDVTDYVPYNYQVPF